MFLFGQTPSPNYACITFIDIEIARLKGIMNQELLIWWFMNDPGIPDIASFRQAGDTAPGAEHHSRPKHQEGVLLRQVHRSPGHKGDVWWNIQERYLSSKIVIATSSKAFLIVSLLVWINWSVIFTMGFFCVMWFIDWKCCDWMSLCFLIGWNVRALRLVNCLSNMIEFMMRLVDRLCDLICWFS